MKIWIYLLAFLFVTTNTLAQRNVRDSIIATPWIGVHYGFNGTAGDLSQRYGNLNHIGILAGYKTKKNWFWGMESNFIFGNQIRLSSLFTHLLDSKGNINDVNGDVAKVVLYARGFNVNFSIGKIFPVFGPNPNSGIFVHAGAGFLAHKLRIETQDQVVPQLELDYRKGYDRLSMGPNIHEFIGYAFMANRGFVNFYAGFYAQQGFTKNMRTIFFDQPDVPVSQETLFDYQYGVKAGWFIPFYKRQPKEFYFD
jgi:hypothetical protein